MTLGVQVMMWRILEMVMDHYNKFCKDCKYHSNRWCSAPFNGIDPVDGKVKSQVALFNRRDPKLCGNDAVHFVKIKPFWKIWSSE